MLRYPSSWVRFLTPEKHNPKSMQNGRPITAAVSTSVFHFCCLSLTPVKETGESLRGAHSEVSCVLVLLDSDPLLLTAPSFRTPYCPGIGLDLGYTGPSRAPRLPKSPGSEDGALGSKVGVAAMADVV
jgi:hypothetical protein